MNDDLPIGTILKYIHDQDAATFWIVEAYIDYNIKLLCTRSTSPHNYPGKIAMTTNKFLNADIYRGRCVIERSPSVVIGI